MNGAALYTAVTSIVSGFSLDETTFYLMLNSARIRREMSRAWMRLRKYDYSQSLSAQNASIIFPPSAIANVPSDFMYFSRDGEITLYNNNNQFETYTEIPMNLAIPYMQANNLFFIDHAAGKIYFLGNIATQYNIFIPYQANFGDITATTSWVNIPTDFHMILAYDVAAMYRLGVSYDDINARNAEKNAQDAELLYAAMEQWDGNLQRSATTRLDYPLVTDINGANFNRKIDIGSN